MTIDTRGNRPYNTRMTSENNNAKGETMFHDPHAEIGMTEFRMFNVVMPSGHKLLNFRKRPKQAAKRDEMTLTDSPLRIARVAQLAELYATRGASETSPFEDESADINAFLANVGK